MNFRGFIDDETSETDFLGKQIVKFSELNEASFVLNCSTMRPKEARDKISMTTNHQLHVFTFLEKCPGIEKNQTYWNDFRLDFVNRGSEYTDFERSLSDDVSLSIWEQIKSLRLSGEFLNLDLFPKKYGKHYFPEFLNFNSSGEVFYDIGGFDGETTLDFIEECSTYLKIYTFEPNPDNYKLLSEKLRTYRDVEIVTKGISNSNQLSGFSSGRGSASHFDSASNLKIELTTLDSLPIHPPTFIKMDIEGMERFALEGGRTTIARFRPKLAISVYHLFDDVRVIFGLISELVPNSQFFLRHYSDGVDETVLFCIPN